MSRFFTSLVQVGLLVPVLAVIAFIVIDFHQEGMERIRKYNLRQENKNDL